LIPPRSFDAFDDPRRGRRRFGRPVGGTRRRPGFRRPRSGVDAKLSGDSPREIDFAFAAVGIDEQTVPEKGRGGEA
jgi:hypothetical protein